MPRQRILLVGAGGRLGRNVGNRLEARNDFDIVRVVRTAQRARDLEADLADEQSVRAAIRASRPDVVLNLAGITGRDCDVNPRSASIINVKSVGWMFDEAAQKGARTFVHTSTSAVYGDRYSTPISETGPLDPRSRYAEMKLESESALAAMARGGETRAVLLRVFNVFGSDFDQSLVQRLWTSTPDRPVTLNGLDDFSRDYVGVDDVVDAMVASSMTTFRELVTTLNVGSGRSTTNRVLVESLARRQPAFWQLGEVATSYTCADITASRIVLGFEPRRFVDQW